MMTWRSAGMSLSRTRTLATCFFWVMMAAVPASARRVSSDSAPKAEKSGWAMPPIFRMARKPK